MKKTVAIIVSLLLNAALAVACAISEVVALLYISPNWHNTIIADNGVFHEGPLELKAINFTKGIVIIFIALAAVAAVNLLLRIWHRHCGMSVLWAIIPAAVIVLGMTIFFLRCGFGFLFEDWSQTVWL